ncbi:MAG: site-specific integrase [Phycisphaerales bacterium]|nr:MAG: site-specific integrase [Phycisphaerales bacterium]
MVNNVRRGFRGHAKRAGLRFNGAFSIHTFRKSCAQNWADYLPPNVVKFYLGHSSMETTNRFYSIVDESHMTMTREAMDKMLNGGAEKQIDTKQTQKGQNDKRAGVEDKPDQHNDSHKPCSDTDL